MGRNLLRGAAMDSIDTITEDGINYRYRSYPETNNYEVVDGYNGNKGWMVTTTDDDFKDTAAPDGHYLGAYFMVPVVPGHTYTASAWVNSSIGLWFQVEVISADGQNRVLDAGDTTQGATATRYGNSANKIEARTWQQVSNTFTVPSSNKGYVLVAMWTNQLGSFTLSEPKMEEGSDITAFCLNEKDLKGEKGDQGELGPMAFFSGEWDRTKTYIRMNSIVPIVRYKNAYWYQRKNGTSTGDEPSSTSTVWRMGQAFDIVMANIVMATFGKIASAIFSGDFMFSQRGRKYDTDTKQYEYSDNYTDFDTATYENSDERDWRPLISLDFKKGIMRAIHAIFDDVSISGIIKANLFYGKTKTVVFSSSSPEYVIDPASDPASTFFVDEPMSFGTEYTFRLPKASDYEGLEIAIYCKHQNVDSRMTVNSHFVYVGCKESSDHLYVKQNLREVVGLNATKFGDTSTSVCVENIGVNYTDFVGKKVSLQMNSFFRFKSIGGAWYAIEGVFIGE